MISIATMMAFHPVEPLFDGADVDVARACLHASTTRPAMLVSRNATGDPASRTRIPDIEPQRPLMTHVDVNAARKEFQRVCQGRFRPAVRVRRRCPEVSALRRALAPPVPASPAAPPLPSLLRRCM